MAEQLSSLVQGYRVTQRRSHTSKKQPVRKYKPWKVVIGTLVSLMLLVGLLFLLSEIMQPGIKTTPIDPAIQNALNKIDIATFEAVGKGSVQNPLRPIRGAATQPILLGPTGKPLILFSGAEYCPFCAAQRWALVVALKQFGTFSHLNQTISSEGNISTLSFYKSTYASSYIDFIALETPQEHSNQAISLTAQERRIIRTYDAPPYVPDAFKGEIPFIDIANQAVTSGASYDTQVTSQEYSGRFMMSKT